MARIFGIFGKKVTSDVSRLRNDASGIDKENGGIRGTRIGQYEASVFNLTNVDLIEQMRRNGASVCGARLLFPVFP